MSAIRLARGFTRRDKIIKFDGCYHGHADSLLVKAGSGALTFGNPDSAGVPASFTEQLAKRLQSAGVKPERLTLAVTHSHTTPMISSRLVRPPRAY